MQSVLSTSSIPARAVLWFIAGSAVLLSFQLLAFGRQDESRETTIAKLIYQLDEADSLSKRTSVENQILGLGKDALKGLANPPKGIRQQTKLTLSRIQNEIEKQLADSEIAPSKVSLAGDYSLESAIAAIEAQTGNQFQLPVDLESAPKENFQIKEAEFWQAVDLVLDRFKLTQSRLRSGEQIKIVRREANAIPRIQSATYCGIVRAEPQWIQSFIDLTNPQLRTDRLLVRFEWEPRLATFQVAMDPEKLSATASGEALKISQNNRLTVNVPGGKNHIDLEIPFGNLKRSVTRIQSVSGRIQMKIPAGKSRFEFDISAGANASKRIGNTLVKVGKLKSQNNIVELPMSFAITNAGDSLASHQGWMFRNAAYVLSADGKRANPVKTLTTKQDPTSMGFTFSFDLPDGTQGYKFVYETPSAIRDVPVEFEIRDIELK